MTSELRDFTGIDLCSLLHQHSRESHNRRTDDVTMDLDSDNLKTQISTLEGKMNEMTAEAEKSEHRLSTALPKLKQQSQTPKSQKASDTPTPGVHSAHTGKPKRRDMIEKCQRLSWTLSKEQTKSGPLQLPGQTGDEAYARKCAKN